MTRCWAGPVRGASTPRPPGPSLREVDRLAREEIAESFDEADRNPPVFDPGTHEVPMPEAFAKSYHAFMDAEWFRLELPAELGGQPAPADAAAGSIAELVLGANPPVCMYAAGPNFAHVVYRNGNDRDKQIAHHMVERKWGATMVLTEPDAGSDVGAGRTKATAATGRHLAHRGREAVHHLRRARHVREHRPPRAGPAEGMEGGAVRARRASRCSSCRSTTSTSRPAS